MLCEENARERHVPLACFISEQAINIEHVPSVFRLTALKILWYREFPLLGR